MGWLRTIAGARWFPYVLIGVASIALTVFGWGYMKGYDKAETVYLEQMNKALEQQMKQLLAQKQLEIRLALRSEARKHDVARKAAVIKKPSVSCDLPPACVQWYDNILRATATDRPSPD